MLKKQPDAILTAEVEAIGLRRILKALCLLFLKEVELYGLKGAAGSSDSG